MSKVLLVPGASATGRDYLLEQLLKNQDVINGFFGREVKMKIATKITDRESRTVELTKRCISQEEFDELLNLEKIIASYVLESNGKRYGYQPDAFEPEESVDLLVADASLYQLEELKNLLKDRVYVATMIASREYRRKNLEARGSESPEEVNKRLNLGDAHVALAILMNGGRNYSEFVEEYFANLVSSLISGLKIGINTENIEKAIEDFTGSFNISGIIKNLVQGEDKKLVDKLLILDDRHRISPDMNVTETEFFKLGLEILNNALN
jgi:ribose 1,5-bisphosphokinase PhnN